MSHEINQLYSTHPTNSNKNNKKRQQRYCDDSSSFLHEKVGLIICERIHSTKMMLVEPGHSNGHTNKDSGGNKPNK